MATSSVARPSTAASGISASAETPKIAISLACVNSRANATGTSTSRK